MSLPGCPKGEARALGASGHPVSAFADAVNVVKDALRLTDEVKRTGATVKELAAELRDIDRRLTRLEAQWEMATAMSQRRNLRVLGRDGDAG
jgi:molybdopterin biosynthesis enzyme